MPKTKVYLNLKERELVARLSLYLNNTDVFRRPIKDFVKYLNLEEENLLWSVVQRILEEKLDNTGSGLF